MEKRILRNLNDILNAPKLKEQNTILCFDWKDYPIDDEEKTQEVDYDIIENMTRKELKNLAQTLKSECLEFDYDSGTILFDFEKYVVVIVADEDATYDGYDFDDWAKSATAIIVYEKEEIKELPVVILNTTILTTDGEFSLKTISLEDAKDIIKDKEIISAVGHQATSDVLTDLLGVEIPVNRINFEQQAGQKAICFKLKGRAPEGKTLSVQEMTDMGYEFKLLEMKKVKRLKLKK